MRYAGRVRGASRGRGWQARRCSPLWLEYGNLYRRVHFAVESRRDRVLRWRFDRSRDVSALRSTLPGLPEPATQLRRIAFWSPRSSGISHLQCPFPRQTPEVVVKIFFHHKRHEVSTQIWFGTRLQGAGIRPASTKINGKWNMCFG